MMMEVTKSYSYPFHITLVSDKPGKCGKNLALSIKENMKNDW